jgi:ABC-type multidrug transport system permease subunit
MPPGATFKVSTFTVVVAVAIVVLAIVVVAVAVWVAVVVTGACVLQAPNNPNASMIIKTRLTLNTTFLEIFISPP